MGRALYRLGRFCAVHPLIVLLAWIVLAAGVVGAKSALGSMTSNDQTLPGTQSQQASDLLKTYFPPQQNGSSPIVFHVSKGKITDQANKRRDHRMRDLPGTEGRQGRRSPVRQHRLPEGHGPVAPTLIVR